SEDVSADGADQVDGGVGDDPGGLDELVAGGLVGDGEAGPVGVGVGLGADGVGDGGAQKLVDHQQGVDLLHDTDGSVGAEHPAGEDAGFQFQVDGFDLPPLVVEPDQVGRRERLMVEQCGGQPVDPPLAAGGGA